MLPITLDLIYVLDKRFCFQNRNLDESTSTASIARKAIVDQLVRFGRQLDSRMLHP